ncbi:glycosyl transferase family 41-domain-containing protein [Lineolata rhizophorae]|uniref:protein O-GlcNAc transferase n=1 Tax=Lineolata rhizophorae TaxID=578093 RepID=A0A6A6NXI6_9PEZI|nr:glycosyl transferase family 41-domain-containing protein [Lineolata rhizophorae]
MAMIRQQFPPHQQAQPHLFGHNAFHGSFNSLPASPQLAPGRGLPRHNSYQDRHHHHQQQLQVPQQYAHPLQRTNSHPTPRPNDGEPETGAPLAENMLRRKTPNGILTAAYDGTSVEHVEKPHAMKHILLPVSATAEQHHLQPQPDGTNNFPYGMKQELPLRFGGIPTAAAGNEHKRHAPQGQDTPEKAFGNMKWQDAAEMEALLDPSNPVWQRGGQQQPAQIDSVLNQFQFPVNNIGQPKYFKGLSLPPSFHYTLGPTTSNEQGSYGPLWPNGSFVPHRQSAFQAARFYPQPPSHWNQYQVAAAAAAAAAHHGADFPLYGNAIGPGFSGVQQGQQPQFLSPHSTGYNVGTPGSFNGSVPQQGGLQYNQPAAAQQGYFQPSLDAATPQAHHMQHQMQMANNAHLSSRISSPPEWATNDPHGSGQTTPRAMQTPMSTPDVMLEYGPQSQNAQLREKMFTWAHQIYVDLLAYLQQTRRHSMHGRQANGQPHPPRPNIYPKPPRQPGSNLAASTISRRHSEAGASQHHQMLQQQQQKQQQAEAVNLVFGGTDQQFNTRAGWAGHGYNNHHVQQMHHQHQQQPNHHHFQTPGAMGNDPGMVRERLRTLRRQSAFHFPGGAAQMLQHEQAQQSQEAAALSALKSLEKLCLESNWQWVEGMLLGGCLSYALADYKAAMNWYMKVCEVDAQHVEAISNIGATMLAQGRKTQAEHFWIRAVRLRPNYFEAAEHLVGLLCGEHRGKEAVQIIDFIERSLQLNKPIDKTGLLDDLSERSSSVTRSPALSEISDKIYFEYDGDGSGDQAFKPTRDVPGMDQPGFGSSGYAIPGSENGRILALVHAKGNMLYSLGDNAGAAKAFENAVLIGTGRRNGGIGGLIKTILQVVTQETAARLMTGTPAIVSSDPILLTPPMALNTARLCFPGLGDLPGLQYVPNEGMARKAAISTTSNALLSLAKIFQDGMAANSPKAAQFQTAYGVREILALYYLSLSLQPSPSTANNVGILLAGVQQAAPVHIDPQTAAQLREHHKIPGVTPGSGVHLALAYYNYGLNLDNRHAHLYTNLGSLLKDIGQLQAAIAMYDRAVQCDPNFDIALANLANAVKDQGRIREAIEYYQRAVNSSPDFAEAVCGLANALNSVCNWIGRGGIAEDGGRRDPWHVDDKNMLLDATIPGAVSSGWIKRVVDLVDKQLAEGEDWGVGMMDKTFLETMLRQVSLTGAADAVSVKERQEAMKQVLHKWAGKKWEGARLVRLTERAIRRLTWLWYRDTYVNKKQRNPSAYVRPQLPPALTIPSAPTVLPFHTFTCPMSARQIRLISQRNGLRISCSALKAPWMPATVYPPPKPPAPYLKVGYVSSDFNNHPLAHLMQSVFGMHDTKRVKAYCYATTARDGSVHREQIEREAPVFHDASAWSAEKLVNQIVADGIHILVNLNGYTRGARNEVFAARPAPVQMSFMGFAGTLGAEWCDYLLADETAIPPSTLRPWRRNVDLEDQLRDDNCGGGEVDDGSNGDDWIYGENIIYCRDTFFCCDHRQSAPDAGGDEPRLSWEEEVERRWEMRKEIFPNLKEDAIILGNFNQLYKIEPTTFRTWLRILANLPQAVLWLLRFPDLGEHNLKQTARLWAGQDVADRILFTDVAPKHLHISRARVCDLFLDTPECNAHTTAADILWSGTPLLTLPRYGYKMCSRMAASILKGALPRGPEGERAARELVAETEAEYQAKAIRLVSGCWYEGHEPKGRLAQLRRLLYESRWESALFDTGRWVKDLEEAYAVAWERWVRGEGGDIWLERKEGRGRGRGK